MAENIPESQEIELEQTVPPLGSQEQGAQKNWGKIGVWVTVALFLATAGVLGFYVFRGKRPEEFPQPTQAPVPTATLVPILTPTPTPTPTPVVSPILAPTPDPTAEWKTYTNTKYGFLIKYPNNKQVEIDTTNPYLGLCNLNKAVVALRIYSLGFQKPPIETEFSGDLIVVVDVEKNSDNLSVEEWVGKNCQGSWLTIGAKKETVNIAGLEATKFTRVGEGMGIPENQPMIIFKKNGLMYFIHPYGKKEIFDLMLSTFKFLG